MIVSKKTNDYDNNSSSNSNNSKSSSKNNSYRSNSNNSKSSSKNNSYRSSSNNNKSSSKNNSYRSSSNNNKSSIKNNSYRSSSKNNSNKSYRNSFQDFAGAELQQDTNPADLWKLLRPVHHGLGDPGEGGAEGRQPRTLHRANQSVEQGHLARSRPSLSVPVPHRRAPQQQARHLDDLLRSDALSPQAGGLQVEHCHVREGLWARARVAVEEPLQKKRRNRDDKNHNL